MSAENVIGLGIRCLASLIKSCIDLHAQYQELASMRNGQGQIVKVDVVVKDPATGRDIGFQKTENGDYRIITDSLGLNDTQAKAQQDFVKQIRQRYAYNKVLEQLKKQGYIIAQEEKVADNTIHIVARKWS